MTAHSNHEDRLAELRERNAEAESGGGPERYARQRKEGKLSARERIDLLLDEGTFEELDKFVRHQSHDFGLDAQRPAGDGFITGYGRIDGRSSTSSRRISRSLAARFPRPTLPKLPKSWTWRCAWVRR